MLFIDVDEKYVANIVIETIQNDQPRKFCLWNTEIINKVNYSTITKQFDQSIFF